MRFIVLLFLIGINHLWISAGGFGLWASGLELRASGIEPGPEVLVTSSGSLDEAATARSLESILAVVGETPILASDVVLADLVNLVPQRADVSPEDHRSKLLDARIRLELQFRDLEGSGALHRLHVDPKASIEHLTAAGGGREGLYAALSRQGLTWDDVEDLALRQAAAAMWVEQRLRPRITVSGDEVHTALRVALGDQDAAAFEGPGPMDPMIRSQAHRLVFERKLNDEIERWLEEARNRQGVTRFVP